MVGPKCFWKTALSYADIVCVTGDLGERASYILTIQVVGEEVQVKVAKWSSTSMVAHMMPRGSPHAKGVKGATRRYGASMLLQHIHFSSFGSCIWYFGVVGCIGCCVCTKTL